MRSLLRKVQASPELRGGISRPRQARVHFVTPSSISNYGVQVNMSNKRLLYRYKENSMPLRRPTSLSHAIKIPDPSQNFCRKASCRVYIMYCKARPNPHGS